MTSVPPALECADVTVRYDTVTALDGVSMRFAPARIHAVVGQNGAGKSTFARVCAGIVTPQHGTVRVAGQALAGGDVRASRAAGVALVHQSFALPPSLTVAEAMEFGNVGPRGRLFTRRSLRSTWRDHLERFGVTASADARIRDLPIEIAQAVEIARALIGAPSVLILDEPTAVLSTEAADRLFARLRAMVAESITILVVLHKTREVKAVADEVTVLRSGRAVLGPVEIADLSEDSLASAIIGAPAATGADGTAVPAAIPAGPHRSSDTAQPLLRLVDVCTRADREGPALDRTSMAVHQGEIVGVAGVEGNGQRTLVRTLAAITSRTAGRILLGATDVTSSSLAERRAAGLRIIPFDRNTEGLSTKSTLWQNWGARSVLASGRLFARVRPADLRRHSEQSLRSWGVVFRDVDQPAGSLSGGNAQKVVLAREIDEAASVIIAAQPTRGLDIGAARFVSAALQDARAAGKGVLVISSDLDELFALSDRILVMQSGRIVAEFAAPFDLATVGHALTAGAA